MEPPDPSFADEFNVPHEDAVLVFDVRRAAVSLPFQVHRLKVLVEADLVAYSSAGSEFADEVPKEAQHGSLAHLPKFFFQPSSRPFEGCCCGLRCVLNGDSVRSDLSVRQRADGVCQPLRRELNSWRHVLGPLVKAFCDARVKPR